MEISEDWKIDVEMSKEPILEWIEAVLEHWTTKKRNLFRHRRRHKMVKQLLDVPGEKRTFHPFLPVLFDFLEDRYSFSFESIFDPESELVDNPALYEIFCLSTELYRLVLPYTLDKEGPFLMQPEDSRLIKEKLTSLLHIMAGTLEDEDFENDQDLLDSDLAYQIPPEDYDRVIKEQ